jgi:putative tryptophan/tyrosine transport system substrate-binding protein
MRRRGFIAGLGCAAVWPLVARAQQGERARRVGVLMDRAATDGIPQTLLAAFTQGLHQLGWAEGQNLRLDVRWSAGDAELAGIYAAQLIGLMPDVIVASTTNNLIVVRQATATVPVVFVAVSDPVAQGFVASMSRPGGNITGFSNYEFSVGSKWLGLLNEAAPNLVRVAVMFNPDTSPPSKFLMQAVEAAAPQLGLQAIPLLVRATADIEPALQNFARQPNGGLVLTADSFISLRQALVIDLASRYRLPSIGPSYSFAKDGGLIEYSSEIVDLYRQAASYVDRILRGAKPSDLPVQAPTEYRLRINLKTAKALGLMVPSTLLALADEVIE